jgi:hypothetical protein
MIEMDFDKYKAAWKSEQGFAKNTLTEADIQGFLKRRSKEIYKLFKKGLIFDIVLKSVIGASFIVLSIMVFSSMKIVVISSLMIVGIIAASFFQAGMLNKIPYADYAEDNLRKVLEGTISFYKNKYIRSLYVAALSNTLFIISGMLYYFYFKYGELRPFETDDYVVFGLVFIISFVFGAFMQIKLHNFHIRQLEQCLTEIDENIINELTIKRQNRRRGQLFLIFLLAIICGLLILAFILSRT